MILLFALLGTCKLCDAIDGLRAYDEAVENVEYGL